MTEEEHEQELKDLTQPQRLELALEDLLDMLTEWDNGGDGRSGFAGFHAVNQAEYVLGQELSQGSS